MASWRDIEDEAPELAARARAFLDGRKHKTIATLRKDGSPRISGTEANVVDGELMWGSMWKAMKALDLRRDPRFALHSGSEDPPDWSGDVKVSGRAEELDDDEGKAALVKAQGNEGGGSLGQWHLFRADIEEVVVARLNDARDKMVIELWRPGQGVKTTER
ncbi:MAG TPA: pyridoxamine 5'-phosphate oxidase family protein [Solirubrobacteraceae bacterium]|jgi:nitroimidazol reductase NimA-like FMN-containing flavoprotein (pyridoxamine 5'-phosphate oxidase superfamily)